MKYKIKTMKMVTRKLLFNQENDQSYNLRHVTQSFKISKAKTEVLLEEIRNHIKKMLYKSY